MRRGPALRNRKRQQRAARAIERPTQVHGRGPRRSERGAGVREVRIRGVAAERQPYAPGRGRADQGSAAHEHRADRVRGIVERREPGDHEGMRQLRLIDDLDSRGAVMGPDEADPPLAVDADAVASLAIAAEFFQAVSRRKAQRAQGGGVVKHLELALGNELNAREAGNVTAVEQRSGVKASERLDHIQYR